MSAVLDSFWRQRLERAAELAGRWPFAAEVLEFFHEIGRSQGYAALHLPVALPEDPGFLADSLPELLDVVHRAGPPDLVEAAKRGRSRSRGEWADAILSFWRGDANGSEIDGFFTKVLLQPYARAFAQARRAKAEAAASPAAGSGGVCPYCGHRPGWSVLREDKTADALVRSLGCSLCGFEWSFPRILCPGCREESPEKLPRFAAQEVPWIRVEACDSCRRYLKAVDLTKEPAAEPSVDELASIPLDVLAEDEGYTKLEPNLAGI